MTNERFKELVKDGFYVKVNNEKEAMCVLKMCEKHGIKWITDKKATSYKPNGYEYPYFLHISKWSGNTAITYLNANDAAKTSHKVINIKEFLHPKRKIHITRKGNETHAILKQDGKVIKHTVAKCYPDVAKCHPDDEYDFEVESNIAYGRLFLDDSVEAFKREYECNFKPQFKVGDIVRIRQWDDMAKEFGVTPQNVIKLSNTVFTPLLREYCGELCRITSIDDNEKIGLDFLGEGFDNRGYWSFTTDMIELYQSKRAKIGEYVIVVNNESNGFKIGEVVKRDNKAEYSFGSLLVNEFVNNEGLPQLLQPSEYVVLGKAELPLLNCKFIVGNDVESLTAGKIYEVKDGVFKDDSDEYFPCLELGDEPLHTLYDLKDFIGKAGAGHYTDMPVEYIVLKED